MKIQTNFVNNLSDYFECISKIGSSKNTVSPPILWFRGLSDINHSLVPSLFRTDTRVKRAFNSDYSNLHYAEDIRTQHYIAKNYHFFKNVPSSRIEWLEVMQHHLTKTRVLDWSESSIHSLIFAIEPFLDNQRFHSDQRQNNVPCVWVLNPKELNKGIYKKLHRYFKSNGNTLDYVFKELSLDSKELCMLKEKILRFSYFKLYGQTDDAAHIDYIVNLSAINDEILRDRSRLKHLLLNGDIINPYYYLLSRIYSDGHILEDRTFPPLAVVTPYHSERIKAQHGVFTVFPFYAEKLEEDNKLRKMGINPDGMERNAIASPVLHKIIINNPYQIALELLKNGMSPSWLYPEMPILSNEIENHQVYN